MRYDEKIIKAILSMKADSPDAYETFKEFITNNASKAAIESCSIKEEVVCRWSQGQAQVLAELANLLANARSLADKLENGGKRA